MQRLKRSSLFQEACYINGIWVKAESGETIPVNNPFNNRLIGYTPNAGKAETTRAIDAAYMAFPKWKALSAKERSDILWRWAHLIDQHREDLALIMTQEQGKPLTESRGEIDYANAFIKWFAEEARRVYGDLLPSNKRHQHLIVMKQPIGVVAAITPWNFPAAMITRKIAPAFAAGCTIVVKPDEKTPFSAYALAVLAEEAGMPAGVFNIITGKAEEIGEEMTSNVLVRKLSFTGSTKVGRLLMAQCAPTIKKISLELGGNAPFIVFDDADVEAATRGAIASKFRNSGQTCVCANRLLIQDDIYDEFTERFVESVSKLKVGNGLEEGIQQGPLIDNDAMEKVQSHVEDALSKGAQVKIGGKPHALGGLFFEPTVLTDVTNQMLLAHEETFGPVAGLFKFHHEEEAIQLSNDTIYGLASYFYSSNIDRIWRVAQALEYGMVGINAGILSTEVAPFGGVKQSGIGREGSKYGIDEYLELKYLCMEEVEQ